MRSDMWARRGLSVFVLLAPLVAAGDEPVGETPAANKQPPEQTADGEAAARKHACLRWE